MDTTGVAGWRPWPFVKLISGEIDASQVFNFAYQDDAGKWGVTDSSRLVVTRSERPKGKDLPAGVHISS